MRLSALLVVLTFVVARIKQNIGVPWTEPTVDTFEDGDSTTRVTGIAVTMMAKGKAR